MANNNSTIELDIITSISLFDYIDVLLFDKEKYSKIADSVKHQHFFMLQRRLAIMFPTVVNSANINGIDSVAVSNLYHLKLYQPSSRRKPGWLFTKSAKPFSVSEEVTYELWHKTLICNVHNITSKDFDSLVHRFPAWVNTQIGMIERSFRDKLTDKQSAEY